MQIGPLQSSSNYTGEQEKLPVPRNVYISFMFKADSCIASILPFLSLLWLVNAGGRTPSQK